MDISKATDVLGGATGVFATLLNKVAQFISKIVTIKNIFFVLILFLIAYISFHLWKQETIMKRRRMGHKREL